MERAISRMPEPFVDSLLHPIMSDNGNGSARRCSISELLAAPFYFAAPITRGNAGRTDIRTGCFGKTSRSRWISSGWPRKHCGRLRAPSTTDPVRCRVPDVGREDGGGHDGSERSILPRETNSVGMRCREPARPYGPLCLRLAHLADGGISFEALIRWFVGIEAGADRLHAGGGSIGGTGG